MIFISKALPRAAMYMANLPANPTTLQVITSNNAHRQHVHNLEVKRFVFYEWFYYRSKSVLKGKCTIMMI